MIMVKDLPVDLQSRVIALLKADEFCAAKKLVEQYSTTSLATSIETCLS